MKALAVTGLLCLAVPTLVFGQDKPAGKAGDPRLVGRWHSQPNEMTKIAVVMLPDGRYSGVITLSGVDIPQRGRYLVDGDKLTYDVEGGKPSRYTFSVQGDVLTVKGTEIGDLVYRRVPGSEKKVVEEAKAADEAKAKEDEEWRKRFAVAVLAKQPPHVPVGEVPADPKPAHIFDKPAVFTKPQLYLRESQVEFVYKNNNPPGVFRTFFHWHFLSTGRVFVLAVTYSGSERVPTRPGAFYVGGKDEKKHWGRYRIENDEQLFIEIDDGSKLNLQLIDGRRNLAWDRSVYGNVEWELEALKRFQEKGK